jgi:hypothetical protein
MNAGIRKLKERDPGRDRRKKNEYLLFVKIGCLSERGSGGGINGGEIRLECA